MSHSTWVLKTEFQSSPRAVLTSNCWTKQLLLTLVCDKQILLQNRDSSSPWRRRCPREEQSPLSQEPPADWQEPGKGNFLSQDASWWQMPLNFRQCQAVSFYQDVGCVNQTAERESYLQRKSYQPILLGTVLLLFTGVSAVPCCGTHESHTQWTSDPGIISPLSNFRIIFPKSHW